MSVGRRTSRVALGAILLAGAILRWTHVRWDESSHLHPDERFTSMVEEALTFPRHISEYFDSAHSTLNPYNRGHDSYVYGTLPLLLTKTVAARIKMVGYDRTYVVGRVLSGLFDLFSIWLTYLLARRFGGRGAALTAAALLAFCPLGIQLSHFWAVDTFLTTFVVLALLLAVRLAREGSDWTEQALAGAALGAAIGCKVTALALFAPVGLAILFRAARIRAATPDRSWKPALNWTLRSAVTVLLSTLVAVRIALPYAFRGVGLDPRYVRDIKGLINLGRSVAGFPPALQWAGRTIFFPIDNFVSWGAGPFFGLAAIAATVWAFFALWKKPRRELALLLLFAAIICAYHSLTLAKSIRYFYPAYPVFAVFSGLFVTGIARRYPRRLVARLLPAVVIAGTVLAGLAFSSIYRRPLTRVAVADWIYANIRPPVPIASEAWDDAAPIGRPNHEGAPYSGPAFEIWGPDDAPKVEHIIKVLQKADWLVITSGRVYMNITRLPTVYPMTIAYYRALFEDRLGFERAADFSSYPSLGPISFYDDRAEEQFTVYDHPRVLLFRKTKAFSPERVRSILTEALTIPHVSIWEWEKLPKARRIVGPSLIPSRRKPTEVPAAAAASRSASASDGWLNSSWGAAILFYLAASAVGALLFPVAFKLFRRFSDRGAGLARTLGLVMVTYVYTLAVRARLVPNSSLGAWIVLIALAAVSCALWARSRREMGEFWRSASRRVVAGEVAFLAGYVFFLGFRAFNPEIFWGEKPMDFSILNILVRTPSLPASDPWFAGAPLGYYTFGQEMLAFLTLLCGLSTRYVFNLAFGLLGGLIVQGAFCLGREWGGRVRTGVAAAGLLAFAGNFAGPREWITVRKLKHLPLDWDYFWATTRVIRDTINEYPFWSLVFADLHAHVLAIPLFLLMIGLALEVARAHADPESRARERLAGAAAFGFAVAAQVLTNAWDVPFLLGMLVIVGVVAALAGRRGRIRSLARGAAALVVAAAAAFLVARPLWVRGGGLPGHGWNAPSEKGAAGVDIVTVYGVFFFLAAAWWVAAAREKLREKGVGFLTRFAIAVLVFAFLAVTAFVKIDVFLVAGIVLFLLAALLLAEKAEDRLACGLVAAGFFLVLFPQRAFIYDRMNTFFKLYLEAWLVFALATAVLVFGSRAGNISRWPVVVRSIVAILFAGALFTTLTAGRGALQNSRQTYRRGPHTPTLDGMRYLESEQPGEARAVAWMRRSIRGTPVIVEAHGDSYREFGRISMLTGLPTVLGWDYHVQQRGNPPEEVTARREAVQKIYSSPEATSIEPLLRRYHVGYVYVGWVERKTYPTAGLTKFETSPELFAVVYENPEAKVYRVIGGDTQDVLIVREAVLPPTPAAEAAPPAPVEASEPEEKPAIRDKAEPGRAAWAGMKEPRDGSVDERGRVWIADFGNSRLRIFDEAGGFLGGWGGRGNGPYGFNQLCAVAVGGENLYVADTWNGRVEAFGLDGRPKASVSELYGPRGIAVASDGTVWVADTGNNRILAYDRELQNPRVYGQKGKEEGELAGPVGIAVSKSGEVYVADTGNRRIQVFNSEGRPVRSWKILGWGDGVEPHVEVDDESHVFVSDPPHDMVLEFDSAGGSLQRWTANAAGEKFSRPSGLALNRKKRILYVVNSGNNSVSSLTLPEKEKRK